MLRKYGGGGGGGEVNSSGSATSGVDPNGLQFVFPQAGPLKPPEPPATFTAQQLDTAYTQAIKLWPDISKQSCANALSSQFADGDANKAIVLIQFYRDAAEGYVTSVFKRNGSLLALRGAMNYGGISCYMDSLLVAMFSRMENFEPLLYRKRYEDRATDRLATWMRLFVNLLRNGERITPDIVEALLATAVAAGWTEGSTPLSQQDAAEFFVFITEKLKMPLLALKVDIAHAGKEVEEYDHKLIREQLIYLPVPGSINDPPILLEECLEVYFSNTINVSRHLARPSMPSFRSNSSLSGGNLSSIEYFTQQYSPQHQVPSRRRSYSIMSLTTPFGPRKAGRYFPEEVYSTPPVPSLSGSGGGSNIGLNTTVSNGSIASSSSNTNTPVLPSTALFKSHLSTPLSPPSQTDEYFDPLDESESAVLSTPEPPSRSASGQPLDQPTPPPPNPHSGSLPSYHQLFGFNEDKQADERIRDMKQSLWTSDNEITLPAWMFLQLLPFYADISPNKDSALENLEADEVANHFRQTRPVLGFCLKRYFCDDEGHPQRNNRIVIVPEEITMPSFVADDSDQKHAFGSFKLVLESALFHRGNTINSGHYCALLAEDFEKHRKPSSHNINAESSRFSWNGVPASAVSPPGDHSSSVPSANPKSSSFNHKQHNSHHHSTGSGGSLSNGTGTSGSGHKKWYLFDDLQAGGDRIKEVDFSSVFEKESPYMLFYRLVSLDDESPRLNYVNPALATPSSTPSASAIASTSPTLLPSPLPAVHQYQPAATSVAALDGQSRPTSRAPSPEPGKDKKKKSKFFRRHKDKERDKQKDYASKYREEKCDVM